MMKSAHFIRTEKKDSLSGLSMYSYKHSSGLSLTYLDKPGFIGKFVAIAVPYGSVDTHFLPGVEPPLKAEGEVGVTTEATDKADLPERVAVQVPDGTAYMLEKMIHSHSLGQPYESLVATQLAAMGALTASYTTYAHTMYSFSCVDHEVETFAIFLKKILQPDFKADLLERIKQSVKQHVATKHSDPAYQLYDRAMKNTYFNHGCGTDIFGTVADIEKISVDHLATVHRNFYQPAALSIVLCGDFSKSSLEHILEQCAQFAEGGRREYVGRVLSPEEPKQVRRLKDEIVRPGAVPSYFLTYKDGYVSKHKESRGVNLLMHRMGGNILLETLIGPSSDLHNELYDKGVINDSFYYEYFRERDFSYVLIGGDSSRPASAAETVAEELYRTVSNRAFDAELFEIQKKVALGRFTRSMDNLETAGLMAARCSLNRVDLLDYLGSFRRIQLDKALEVMKFMMEEGALSSTILWPA